MISFGRVAQPGLTEQFLLDDLKVFGTMRAGGSLESADLIYVPLPEQSTLSLMALGGTGLLAARWRQHKARRCPSI